MSLAAGDMGLVGTLGKALGVFRDDGSHNPDWFGNPQRYLGTILADQHQRDSLVAFVDDALGGEERETDASGVTWLPIVSLEDPRLTFSATLDTSGAFVDVGLGLELETSEPEVSVRASVPLFRLAKSGGPAVTDHVLLGKPGARLSAAASITITPAGATAAGTPGEPSIGAIGLEVALPTDPDDLDEAVFGLTVERLVLPGADAPRDLRVVADGVDRLDDAVLDLVLSLVRAQADAAGGIHPALGAVAGLLGLRTADAVPDFPVTELQSSGATAIAAWVRAIMTTTAARQDWLGHLATLLGGTRSGDRVTFELGAAELAVGVRVDTGPTGNPRLTPTLTVDLGTDDARVEIRADVFDVDLITGAARAFPALGLWAAAGRGVPGHRVIDVTNPAVVRADTLRLGFALDAERRLVFVLAADQVRLGARDYAMLDLTSPDALMDAAGNTVAQVADELLDALAPADDLVRLLLGVAPPAGVTPVTLPALFTDPLGAATGYWRALLTTPATAVAVLEAIRDALSDAGAAVAPIEGDGSAERPWRVPLAGPLGLELRVEDDVVAVGLAAVTTVDTLAAGCTAVETRFAATLAEVDLAAPTASLLPLVEVAIAGYEAGVTPRRVRLALADDATLTAEHVGGRLGWSPTAGLTAELLVPELTLQVGGTTIPVALPVVGTDGSVTLPPEGWDGVEVLVGYLAGVVGGLAADTAGLLGWTAERPGRTGGVAPPATRLRLADLVADPAAALRAWLPAVAVSEAGPALLGLVADLMAGSGGVQGMLLGTGHPDDPFRLPVGAGLPEPAVWFPPAGLLPRVSQVGEAVRAWRPGNEPLPVDALAAALAAEAEVATDLRDLVTGRPVAGGLAALLERWTGSDGRVVPPPVPPAGVTVVTDAVAAGQLLGELDVELELGRTPQVTVLVDLGARAWPDAPAGRRVDLATAGLTADMFALPEAATGEWFVALGRRADCLPAGGTGGTGSDGTAEQAARLRRFVQALAAVSADVVLVAAGGAGHAARAVAESEAAVTALVTAGTPLSPVAFTVLSTQPGADALRLLNRLLPAAPAASTDPDVPAEDADLALGRALTGALMELTTLADPGADLRLPAAAPAAPRAGLEVVAYFGALSATDVGRALTAVVAAGLAERARVRAATPLPPATSAEAGLLFRLPVSTTGTLEVTGEGRLTLVSFDATAAPGAAIGTGQLLRARVRVADRTGWLTSSPDAELRAFSADVDVPLDGAGAGTATVTLHDARVFGRSWEALVLGTGPGAVPVLPEARTLLAAAVQRLVADAAAPASAALTALLRSLALLAPAGGLAADALDQLVHDPGGLVRGRLAAGRDDVANAVAGLLGPVAAGVDLAARSVALHAGSDAAGRFGWSLDLTAALAAAGGPSVSGRLALGAADPPAGTGGLRLEVELAPLRVTLHRTPPGTGATATVVPLWPDPDARAVAEAAATAATSLGGQVALELARRLDPTTRPIVDAALDALGLLGGAPGDLDRPLRSLAGLLADPVAWLRGPASLASDPVRIQALFDALRPLVGAAGAAGSPLTLTDGVVLGVARAGSGARIELTVDAGAWTAPAGAGARLTAGVTAGLTIAASGPPGLDLELFAGVGDEPGRQAVHLRFGTPGAAGAGVSLFLRPATGGDVSLVPFAGLGALAAAAEAALPHLLDELAGVAAPVGPLVARVGDAFDLRSGAPARFDRQKLHDWGTDPVGCLEASAGSIAAAGLSTLAPLVDAYLPAAITATAPTPNTLRVTIGPLALSWTPVEGAVSVAVTDLEVPGVEHLNATLALSPAGLRELSATVGPAAIDTGGVVLRPFVTVAVGTDPAGGRRVVVGLAVDDESRFGARWLFDERKLALVASEGPPALAAENDDPAAVALRLVEVIADVVAAVALRTDAVSAALDTGVGATDVRGLLRGVLLADVANPTQLMPGLFDVDTVLERAHRLVRNLAGAGLGVTVEGLEISFTTVGAEIGVQLGVDPRWELLSGDVSLWLETDDSWLDPDPPGSGGIFLGVLSAATPEFRPTLAVNGVGLRVGSANGPLVDSVITIESIALHVFAAFDLTGVTGGGAQLEIAGLALAPSGGGQNGIAQNVMKDTGPTPPRPAFSPALAVQKHGTAPVSVTLRAGEGDGPWWIAIRRGFGPLYLEQIGFGVGVANHRIERVSLLMDGSVSMFGLTCAVDDLQITYLAGRGDLFNVNSWAVDLGGIAVSASMGGLTIAGGLLKQGVEPDVEYLGMLLARFGTYGITIFGGYGQGTDNGVRFTAFFAVGAINGPIGGPPAFFLTGIGGGFGINRQLKVPTDLSRFGDYPLIQALDIAARPQQPMDQLRALGQYYPMKRGTFWFAAGISFNCFALVDGIAVVAIQVGDGLDINLLGLVRMALPRPQAAIVSIELALLVRFSTSEGVLWVQAQLTDNSWLLYPDVRLTGGFAYVIWFKGEHRGEFVLTLGGYHPDFHREGYPVVPRLGLHWAIGDYIVIEAGTYFALTSEAVMAGGDFHAAARFGPAWADLRFGAHGIIYFDPFRYQVNAYVRISAGITIDLWIFGEVTISVSLGARVEIQGPQFHGVATFEVGPVELSVPFGDPEQTRKALLAAAEFIAKYLDPTPDGALAHAAMVALGASPAKGDDSTPDGSGVRPFVVVPEFGLAFSSIVPAVEVNRSGPGGDVVSTHPSSGLIGVAPMGTAVVRPRITLTWLRSGVPVAFPFTVTPRAFGSFPAGVWGPPQPDDNRPIPQAEMIEALNELGLTASAAPSPGGPTVPYHQVDVGRRKPLPFTRRAAQVSAFKNQTTTLAGLVSQPATVDDAFAAAARFLAVTASPTGLAALRGERQAPPRVGTLGEGLDATAATTVPGIGEQPPGKVYDHVVDAPVAVGLLPGATVDLSDTPAAAATTVKDAARLWRAEPPTTASVDENRSRSIAARLVLAEPSAVPLGGARAAATVIGADRVPVTAVAHGPSAVVRTAGGDGAERLAAFGAALTAGRRVGRGTPGAVLAAGETAVLALPNARADAGDGDRPRLGVTGDPVRVVILAHGGQVLADEVVGGGGEVVIAQGAERIVAVGQGRPGSAASAPPPGLAGWHSGSVLPYAGWSTALAPGCVVRATGEVLPRHRERVAAGWVIGVELARGLSTVVTRFDGDVSRAVSSVVIVLDDPTVLGDPTGGRGLVLGLDGASRTLDAAGRERPPLLLAAENRSVVAYDVVPGSSPGSASNACTVTVATELGWALVGVLASPGPAAEAVAQLAGRGLDAALAPLAAGTAGGSRLTWLGESRSPRERRLARALAAGRPPVAGPSARATTGRSTSGRRRR